MAQNPLPSYPSLLKRFYSEYSYTPKEQVDGLNFAKMKDGWHAQVIDRITEVVKQDQVYYSLKDGYHVLNGFSSADSNNEENVQRFLSGGNLYSWYGYERCRYLDIVFDNQAKNFVNNFYSQILNGASQTMESASVDGEKSGILSGYHQSSIAGLVELLR